MKKEYLFIFIAGLFLLAYVLEAVVNPLSLDLATPYAYLNPAIITHYPFTSTIIIIRALALFLSPTWLLSFLPGNHSLKGVIFLLVAGLAQLYAIQEIATGDQLVPLEWSLSLSLAGLVLLAPTIWHLILAAFYKFRRRTTPPTETNTLHHLPSQD